MAAPQAAPGPRGAFILFEGVDRSGKSTQAKLLVEALRRQGVPAELWNFPDRDNTITGHAINEYLKGGIDLDARVIHQLFCANRSEKSQQLVAALRAGTTLVVDRYAYSGVAYTLAKALPGMDLAWCRAQDAGLPAPDLLVYMRASREVAAARAGFGQERYEKQEFQDKVRAAFELLQEPQWLVQDASQLIEQIHQQVLAGALDAIQRCQEQHEPLRRLWDGQPLALPAAAGQEKRTAGKASGVPAPAGPQDGQHAAAQPLREQPQ